ncbi:MAG: hypothetical protein DRG78_16215, partial [Epsilonproteobacteria bacterium]
TNKDKEEQISKGTYLKTIKVDEQLKIILKSLNLELFSIPKKNQHIRLATTANTSAGGTSEDLTNKIKIHQDNINLAKRIVSILKIDIAAIDILIDDLSQSWREIGASVLEVNAKPQLGELSKLKYLLSKLVINNGEIPSIVVVGKYDKDLSQSLVKQSKNNDKKIGIVSSSGVYINDEMITNENKKLYDASKIVMNDPNVDSMILFIDTVQSLTQGFPIINTDLLVIDTLVNDINLVGEVIDYFSTTIVMMDKASEYLEDFTPLLKNGNIKAYAKATVTKKIKEILR